jgi:hypothetical protein
MTMMADFLMSKNPNTSPPDGFPIEVEEIEERMPGNPRSDKALLRRIFSSEQIQAQQAYIDFDLITARSFGEDAVESRQRLEVDLRALSQARNRSESVDGPIEIDWHNLELSNHDKAVMARAKIARQIMAKLEAEREIMATAGIDAPDGHLMSVAIRRLAVELYGLKILD